MSSASKASVPFALCISAIAYKYRAHTQTTAQEQELHSVEEYWDVKAGVFKALTSFPTAPITFRPYGNNHTALHE